MRHSPTHGNDPDPGGSTVGRIQLLAAAFLLFAAATQAAVQATPTCNGEGLTGSSVSGSVTLLFESCPLPDGRLHAKFWRPDGFVFTDVVYNKTTEAFQAWIGGLEATDSLTPEEVAYMDTVVLTPEGILAASPYKDLEALGYSGTSDAMRMIGAAVIAYNLPDIPPQPNGGEPGPCSGCCGIGCWGCTGIYTQECKDHDECMRLERRPCMGLFWKALKSYFRCLFRGVGCQ